ncbi:hypothetical protein NliqN6_5959 [Naganishia liquefaciens]|uniref:5-formyltetrahydrofolate cyclo-ligase n=1 Tax=Naganishia liquefaciens TaxID=104408 RepID=A0A8H3TYP7_9TREE|nr:hypothetical protein NliqN6_5959 [Naganishia liquefaciens]
MLRLYSKRDLESLARDKWGIPDAGKSTGDLDEAPQRLNCMSDPAAPVYAILVPGVCFDAKSQRLGHGKGYRARAQPTDAALSVRNGWRATDGSRTLASTGARIDRGAGDGRRCLDGLDRHGGGYSSAQIREGRATSGRPES